MIRCNHKRIKRNFPFGKNSSPKRSCKDCGIIITAKQLNKSKRKKK